MWCALKGKQLMPSVNNFAAVQALLAKVPSDEKKKNSQPFLGEKNSCGGDLDYACCRLLLLDYQLV